MRTQVLCAAALAAAFASAAPAQMPQMGGSMKHIMVMRMESMIEAHLDTSVATPELKNYGAMYMGNASVLNGTWYNAQYGWMKDGAWAPPTDSFVWLEQLSATPGLMAFKGGRMSDMASHTFEPIFGTAGSSARLRWDGTMLHNWYAVSSPGGTYEAAYRVYFGDAAGAPLPGYDAAGVTLTWNSVPAPGPSATLAVGGLLALRRRRA